MAHRFNLFLLAAAVATFLASSLCFASLPNSLGSSEQPPLPPHVDGNHPHGPIKHKDSLGITVTETGGSRDQVVAALVHSFGSQLRAKLSLYQPVSRYGIKDIMAVFDLPNKLSSSHSPSNFLSWEEPNQILPDIWVAATCELDLVYYKANLTMLLEQRKTYIFCVIHHADRWGDNTELAELVAPWVNTQRIEFLALSPHTARFLKTNSVSTWTRTMEQVLIRCFVPVFPVTLPIEREQAQLEDNTNTEELGFAHQGVSDPATRNHDATFRGLSGLLEKATSDQARNMAMQLLESGQHPEVPEAVRDHIESDEEPSYMKYYTIASRMFAWLPEFASDEYLDRKASSSVAASLIAGVPLVATQRTLDAYRYLGKDVVWLEKGGESDLDVVKRVLGMTTEERSSKKQRVRERRDEIIMDNMMRVDEWIREAMAILDMSA